MKYFGTDGFRGEPNKELTATQAYRIGRFLGYYFKKELGRRPSIVVGKDTRLSSYMLESALTAGITSSGADSYLLHVTTTPSVSYVSRTDDFACGIMISASHNPYYYNGIKLINGQGLKMEEELLERVEDYIDRPEDDLPLATRDQIGKTRDYALGRNRYIGYLISTARRSFKDRRIGLDCANGSAFRIAKSVFDALGADTYVINNQPDGLNINLNAGSTHMDSLIELVKEEKLDAGFAFDGDADRCQAVDNHGQLIDGDGILYAEGVYLKEKDALPKDTVVTTIMSNMGLFKSLERHGIQTVKTQVGDKNVAAEMFENGYVLGGEQSGHIIFSKYASTGDGVLTAIRLMETAIDRKTDLATLQKGREVYPQLLENVAVKDKNQVLDNEKVQRAMEEADQLLGDEGRTVVRPSGTEPLLRVMAEAKDKALCRQAVEKIVGAIRSEGLARD